MDQEESRAWTRGRGENGSGGHESLDQLCAMQTDQ
jgi:hypothetical protein